HYLESIRDILHHDGVVVPLVESRARRGIFLARIFRDADTLNGFGDLLRSRLQGDAVGGIEIALADALLDNRAVPKIQCDWVALSRDVANVAIEAGVRTGHAHFFDIARSLWEQAVRWMQLEQQHFLDD